MDFNKQMHDCYLKFFYIYFLGIRKKNLDFQSSITPKVIILESEQSEQLIFNGKY